MVCCVPLFPSAGDGTHCFRHDRLSNLLLNPFSSLGFCFSDKLSLYREPKLALNTWSSCLIITSVIIGKCYATQLSRLFEVLYYLVAFHRNFLGGVANLVLSRSWPVCFWKVSLSWVQPCQLRHLCFRAFSFVSRVKDLNSNCLCLCYGALFKQFTEAWGSQTATIIGICLTRWLTFSEVQPTWCSHRSWYYQVATWKVVCLVCELCVSLALCPLQNRW